MSQEIGLPAWSMIGNPLYFPEPAGHGGMKLGFRSTRDGEFIAAMPLHHKIRKPIEGKLCRIEKVPILLAPLSFIGLSRYYPEPTSLEELLDIGDLKETNYQTYFSNYAFNLGLPPPLELFKEVDKIPRSQNSLYYVTEQGDKKIILCTEYFL